MRIAQILHPQASSYERKCQQVDQLALAARHDVIVTTFEGAQDAGAAVAHVYAPSGFEAPEPRFTIPWVAAAAPRRPHFPWRRMIGPRLIVSPLDNLPEAVSEAYFDRPDAAFRKGGGGDRHAVGTFGPHRDGVLAMIEQTLARIHRFRDDVDWLTFDEPPAPSDLALVEAWVDPATAGADYDGFVAEAIAAGKAVVAARTPINALRLEQGRTGFLVPLRDPNELTHAILAALFKPEVAFVKIEAAKQTAGKFRPRQRLRVLEKIYEAVTE